MPKGFEIDFLPVGENSRSGDAICLRYGHPQTGLKIHVVDGGYKDTAETIVNHINTYYGAPNRIDNIILTHSDGDHAGGLVDVLQTYEIGALWMHRPWLYAPSVIGNFHGNWTVPGLVQHFRDEFPTLVELETVAKRKGIPIYEPFQGAKIGEFLVLAPSKSRYLSLLPQFDKAPDTFTETAFDWLGQVVKKAVSFVKETWTGETLSDDPEPTSAVNESSVVQAAKINGKLIVLTGDVGPGGLTEAADFLATLGEYRPYFFQVPHHGSRRNVTPTTLNRWLGPPVGNSDSTRGVAYCSAAKEDDDHPRKKVLNAFRRRGYPVYVTKGKTHSSRHILPSRYGWVESIPEPFAVEVEE